MKMKQFLNQQYKKLRVLSMKNYIKEMLSDGKHASSFRAMFFLWNIYIMICIPIFVVFDKFTLDIASFFGGAMVIIYGGKVGQSHFENRGNYDNQSLSSRDSIH